MNFTEEQAMRLAEEAGFIDPRRHSIKLTAFANLVADRATAELEAKAAELQAMVLIGKSI